MVIDEKGLMRAMKEAYKELGYKVAVEDEADIENVIISYPTWTVVIQKDELPRKVLGLIAEHVGEIPKPGTAFQVSKKQTQTEIFSMAMQIVEDFHSGEKERRIIRRTSLVMGGFPLWQATSSKVVQVSPDLEDIMLWGSRIVRLIGEDILMIDDNASRGYIRCTLPKEDSVEMQKLEHLSKLQWVAG